MGGAGMEEEERAKARAGGVGEMGWSGRRAEGPSGFRGVPAEGPSGFRGVPAEGPSGVCRSVGIIIIIVCCSSECNRVLLLRV